MEQIVASKRRIWELKSEVEGLDRRDKSSQKRLEIALRELESLANDLREAMVTVERRGAVMKDLDVGLLDFPAVREGEAVYFCWRLGEDEIRFFHGVDEGFSGRRPL